MYGQECNILCIGGGSNSMVSTIRSGFYGPQVHLKYHLQSCPKVLGHLSKNPTNSHIPSPSPMQGLFEAPFTRRIIAGAFNIAWGRRGRARAVTKTVSYKQSNRLTQGIFHKCPILRVFLLGVPRTFGQDCSIDEVIPGGRGMGIHWPQLSRFLLLHLPYKTF